MVMENPNNYPIEQLKPLVLSFLQSLDPAQTSIVLKNTFYLPKEHILKQIDELLIDPYQNPWLADEEIPFFLTHGDFKSITFVKTQKLTYGIIERCNKTYLYLYEIADDYFYQNYKQQLSHLQASKNQFRNTYLLYQYLCQHKPDAEDQLTAFRIELYQIQQQLIKQKKAIDHQLSLLKQLLSKAQEYGLQQAKQSLGRKMKILQKHLEPETKAQKQNQTTFHLVLNKLLNKTIIQKALGFLSNITLYFFLDRYTNRIKDNQGKRLRGLSLYSSILFNHSEIEQILLQEDIDFYPSLDHHIQEYRKKSLHQLQVKKQNYAAFKKIVDRLKSPPLYITLLGKKRRVFGLPQIVGYATMFLFITVILFYSFRPLPLIARAKYLPVDTDFNALDVGTFSQNQSYGDFRFNLPGMDAGEQDEEFLAGIQIATSSRFLQQQQILEQQQDIIQNLNQDLSAISSNFFSQTPTQQEELSLADKITEDIEDNEAVEEYEPMSLPDKRDFSVESDEDGLDLENLDPITLDQFLTVQNKLENRLVAWYQQTRDHFFPNYEEELSIPASQQQRFLTFIDTIDPKSLLTGIFYHFQNFPYLLRRIMEEDFPVVYTAESTDLSEYGISRGGRMGIFYDIANYDIFLQTVLHELTHEIIQRSKGSPIILEGITEMIASNIKGYLSGEVAWSYSEPTAIAVYLFNRNSKALIDYYIGINEYPDDKEIELFEPAYFKRDFLNEYTDEALLDSIMQEIKSLENTSFSHFLNFVKGENPLKSIIENNKNITSLFYQTKLTVSGYSTMVLGNDEITPILQDILLQKLSHYIDEKKTIFHGTIALMERLLKLMQEREHTQYSQLKSDFDILVNQAHNRNLITNSDIWKSGSNSSRNQNLIAQAQQDQADNNRLIQENMNRLMDQLSSLMNNTTDPSTEDRENETNTANETDHQNQSSEPINPPSDIANAQSNQQEQQTDSSLPPQPTQQPERSTIPTREETNEESITEDPLEGPVDTDNGLLQDLAQQRDQLEEQRDSLTNSFTQQLQEQQQELEQEIEEKKQELADALHQANQDFQQERETLQAKIQELIAEKADTEANLGMEQDEDINQQLTTINQSIEEIKQEIQLIEENNESERESILRESLPEIHQLEQELTLLEQEKEEVIDSMGGTPYDDDLALLRAQERLLLQDPENNESSSISTDILDFITQLYRFQHLNQNLIQEYNRLQQQYGESFSDIVQEDLLRFLGRNYHQEFETLQSLDHPKPYLLELFNKLKQEYQNNYEARQQAHERGEAVPAEAPLSITDDLWMQLLYELYDKQKLKEYYGLLVRNLKADFNIKTLDYAQVFQRIRKILFVLDSPEYQEIFKKDLEEMFETIPLTKEGIEKYEKLIHLSFYVPDYLSSFYPSLLMNTLLSFIENYPKENLGDFLTSSIINYLDSTTFSALFENICDFFIPPQMMLELVIKHRDDLDVHVYSQSIENYLQNVKAYYRSQNDFDPSSEVVHFNAIESLLLMYPQTAELLFNFHAFAAEYLYEKMQDQTTIGLYLQNNNSQAQDNNPFALHLLLDEDHPSSNYLLSLLAIGVAAPPASNQNSVQTFTSSQHMNASLYYPYFQAIMHWLKLAMDDPEMDYTSTLIHILELGYEEAYQDYFLKHILFKPDAMVFLHKKWDPDNPGIDLLHAANLLLQSQIQRQDWCYHLSEYIKVQLLQQTDSMQVHITALKLFKDVFFNELSPAMEWYDLFSDYTTPLDINQKSHLMLDLILLILTQEAGQYLDQDSYNNLLNEANQYLTLLSTIELQPFINHIIAANTSTGVDLSTLTQHLNYQAAFIKAASQKVENVDKRVEQTIETLRPFAFAFMNTPAFLNPSSQRNQFYYPNHYLIDTEFQYQIPSPDMFYTDVITKSEDRFKTRFIQSIQEFMQEEAEDTYPIVYFLYLEKLSSHKTQISQYQRFFTDLLDYQAPTFLPGDLVVELLSLAEVQGNEELVDLFLSYRYQLRYLLYNASDQVYNYLEELIDQNKDQQASLVFRVASTDFYGVFYERGKTARVFLEGFFQRDPDNYQNLYYMLPNVPLELSGDVEECRRNMVNFHFLMKKELPSEDVLKDLLSVYKEDFFVSISNPDTSQWNYRSIFEKISKITNLCDLIGRDDIRYEVADQIFSAIKQVMQSYPNETAFMFANWLYDQNLDFTAKQKWILSDFFLDVGIQTDSIRRFKDTFAVFRPSLLENYYSYLMNRMENNHPISSTELMVLMQSMNLPQQIQQAQMNRLFEMEKQVLLKNSLLSTQQQNHTPYQDIYVLQLGSLKELYNLIHVLKHEENQEELKKSIKNITIEIDKIFKLQAQVSINPLHIRFLTGEIADLIFKLPLPDVLGMIQIFQDVVLQEEDRSYQESMYYTHLLAHLTLNPSLSPMDNIFMLDREFPQQLKNRILMLEYQLQQENQQNIFSQIAGNSVLQHYNRHRLRDYLLLFSNYIKVFNADDPARNQVRYILQILNTSEEKYRIPFHILEKAIITGNLFGYQEPLAMNFIYSYLEKPLYRRFYDEVHARDKRFIYQSTQNYLDYLYAYPVNTNVRSELNWFSRYFGIEEIRRQLRERLNQGQELDYNEIRKQFARQKLLYLYRMQDFFSEIYGTPFVYTEEKRTQGY